MWPSSHPPQNLPRQLPNFTQTKQLRFGTSLRAAALPLAQHSSGPALPTTTPAAPLHHIQAINTPPASNTTQYVHFGASLRHPQRNPAASPRPPGQQRGEFGPFRRGGAARSGSERIGALPSSAPGGRGRKVQPPPRRARSAGGKRLHGEINWFT